MSRVAVYSGPYHTGKHLHGLRGLFGLGDDPTDVLSPEYDPTAIYTPPAAIDVPYANAPPYSGVVSAPTFIGPALPSGATTEADATPSDIAWLQANEAATPASPNAPLNFQSLSNAIASVIAPGSVPRPSPTVSVPLSTSTMGLWFSSASILAGIPNWMVLAGGFIMANLTFAAFAGNPRRRR